MTHLSLSSIILRLLLTVELLIVMVAEIREIILFNESLIWEILWEPPHERSRHLSFHSTSGERIGHLSIVHSHLHLDCLRIKERLESEEHILIKSISILMNVLSSVSEFLLLQFFLSHLLRLQEVHVLVVGTEEGTELDAVLVVFLELCHKLIRFNLIAKMDGRILELTLSVISASFVLGLLDELQR